MTSTSTGPESRPVVEIAPVSADRVFLERALDLATDNVTQGGGPFGALIVQDGRVIAEGVNRVTRDNDPTAHAEVQAIRAPSRERGDFSLHGATLYTSCEPCPMCLATSLWARVERVVYAGDRRDAARGSFDDLAFYKLFETPRSQWRTTVEWLQTTDQARPFNAWLGNAARTAY